MPGIRVTRHQSAPFFDRSRAKNPSTQTISLLRQRMLDDMRMRNLSPKTQSNYLRAVRQFAGFLHRPPDTASVEDLRNYPLYLVDQRPALSGGKARPTEDSARRSSPKSRSSA